MRVGGPARDEDNLRVPSGLGYALANRRALAAVLPELAAVATPFAVVSPECVGLQLGAALRHQAPPRCPRDEPSVVLLSDGPENTAWYEHRLLAAEMGIRVVRPGRLRARGDGGSRPCRTTVLTRTALTRTALTRTSPSRSTSVTAASTRTTSPPTSRNQVDAAPPPDHRAGAGVLLDPPDRDGR